MHSVSRTDVNNKGNKHPQKKCLDGYRYRPRSITCMFNAAALNGFTYTDQSEAELRYGDML